MERHSRRIDHSFSHTSLPPSSFIRPSTHSLTSSKPNGATESCEEDDDANCENANWEPAADAEADVEDRADDDAPDPNEENMEEKENEKSGPAMGGVEGGTVAARSAGRGRPEDRARG